MLFFNGLGYWPDLDNPKTFNEKLQWLKLNDHNPEYTIMADKVKAKEWVAKRIGWEHIIPTLGVWERAEDVDFDSLPDKFVLKCNHNSGTGIYICKDKSKMDENSVRKELAKGLKEDYYAERLEWQYKNIPRRILAEKFIEVKEDDGDDEDLKDYKFFCFDGVVKALFIASDRNTPGEETKFDFFDSDYNHLPFTNGHPNAKIYPPKPKKFEEMKQLASILSKGLPHIRIDFYEVDNVVYFWELTFTHWSGFKPFDPFEWDLKFGEWLILPNKN